MNLNKVFILGRLTADPQLRTTPTGQSVTSLGVATNRVWTGKSGKQEETEFHNVVVWGRQAEIATKFLTKGATVLLEGRLRTRSWQDKQGQNHRTTEIIADRLELGPKPQGSAFVPKAADGPAPAAQPAPAEDIPIIDLDEGEIKAEELPF